MDPNTLTLYASVSSVAAGDEFDVLMHVEAPKQLGSGKHCIAPNIVVLLDRSGSMDAEDGRMETAKRCAINILRQTPVNGRFTLIAFDDQVETVVDAAMSREAAIDAIESLQPRGMTNIYDALHAAIVAGAQSILLITDGVSNVGLHTSADDMCELVRNFAGMVSLSTMAIGVDADASLLERMCRENGGGVFSYIRTPTVDFEPAIDSFLRYTRSLAYRFACLQLNESCVPPGLVIVGQQTSFKLGTLGLGEVRDVLLRCKAGEGLDRVVSFVAKLKWLVGDVKYSFTGMVQVDAGAGVKTVEVHEPRIVMEKLRRQVIDVLNSQKLRRRDIIDMQQRLEAAADEHGLDVVFFQQMLARTLQAIDQGCCDVNQLSLGCLSSITSQYYASAGGGD